MIARKTLRFIAGLLLAVFAVAPIGAAEPATTGSWTIRPAETQGKVQLTFVYGRAVHSTDWSVSALPGLQLNPPERHDVRFVIERDAGRIEAEGVSTTGTAAGSFRFTPEPGYTGELRKLGLGEIKPEAQLSFALHDVSLAYTREMIGLGIAKLNTDMLIAFRIHGVTSALVTAAQHTGVTPDAGQLVAFAIHGVTPDYIAAIEKLGYDHPTPDQLIAMRIHGVTPDYIASVKARGVRDTSLDQLVAMKIQGID